MAERFSDQQRLLEEQLSEARATTGIPPLLLAAMEAQCAMCLLQQDKLAVAESLLRASLKVREQLASDAWYTFNTKSLLGECLLGQGQLLEAEQLLVEGYEGVKSRAEQIPENVRQQRLEEAAARLVRLYNKTDRAQDAEYLRAEIARLGSDQRASGADRQ
jgi:non-specific serine/threonine protein kinase/serine/threonine-protein kinase